MFPIPTNPDRQTLSQFSEAWLVVWGMIAAPLALWRGHPNWFAFFWLTAIAARLAGLMRPFWLRPIFVGMMYLGWPIGWLVSNFLLAIVYYGVVTPIALIRRSRHRDPLGRSLDRTATTHWTRSRQNSRPDRFFRQF